MSDWDRLHDRPADDEPELETASPLVAAPASRVPWVPLVAGVLALLLAAGGGWWLLRRPERPESGASQPAPGPVDDAPAPSAEPLPELGGEAPGVPVVELPPLDQSDEAVRGLAGHLGDHPSLAAFLAGDHVLRRFVAAVDNVAEGTHPRQNLAVRSPPAPFTVGEGAAARPAAEAYRRYDPWVGAFMAIEPARAAAVYRQLRPRLDEAYHDLGYPGRRFDETLARAIAHLLAAPVPDSPPVLRRKLRSWAYADPALEDLSAAQKQLLRLGPDNQRRVQRHLRQIALALGVPASRLPS